MRVVAALPFVLLLLARAAAAQESATVTGIVVDSLTRAPVADAYVDLGGGRRAATDGEGRFTLCRVAPGLALLRVRAMGFAEREELVETAAGDAAPLSLVLHRSGARQVGEWGPLHPNALVVVDGVRVFASASGCETAPPGMPTLEGIEPGEVERAEVVKPREAVAAYGPEGRHGALRITTKRKAGRTVP